MEVILIIKMKDKNVMEVPPDFNWKIYLELNPDICRFPTYATQEGSISHWKQYGRKEGRPYKRSQIPFLTLKPITVENQPPSQSEVINTIKPNLSNNKIVVYTCISGNYEKLKEVKVINSEIDYVCFTNNKTLTSKTWQIREIPECLDDLDETRKARCIKILPHIFLPEYDISLWIDGNIEIKGDLIEFINDHINKSDFMTTKHPDRICVYDESSAVIKQKKDDEKIVKRQMEHYKNQLYPEKYGMVQTNILLRKHNNIDVINLCNDWWNEVLKHSKRDQLSFNYVCWKNQNVDVEIINPNITSSDYFSIYFHSGRIDTLKPGYGDIINYFNEKEV